MLRYVAWAWIKLFEAFMIVGAISAAFILGVGLHWAGDTAPLFVENPLPGTSYVENATLHAGEPIVVVRSLLRTSACPINSGIWIVQRDGNLLSPIWNFVSTASIVTKFGSSRIAFPLPAWLPPGHYGIRQYASCQRNPLEEIGQQLSDLPFEVVR